MVSAGGTSQPVSHGETSLAAQPLGAIRKASPIATATCGTASSGARKRRTRAIVRVPCAAATKPITIASDSRVASTPLVRVRRTLSPSPGVASISRQCASVRRSPPSAGNQPNAGSQVYSSPAPIGARNRPRAATGKTRSQASRGRRTAAAAGGGLRPVN